MQSRRVFRIQSFSVKENGFIGMNITFVFYITEKYIEKLSYKIY